MKTLSELKEMLKGKELLEQDEIINALTPEELREMHESDPEMKADWERWQDDHYLKALLILYGKRNDVYMECKRAHERSPSAKSVKKMMKELKKWRKISAAIEARKAGAEPSKAKQTEAILEATAFMHEMNQKNLNAVAEVTGGNGIH